MIKRVLFLCHPESDWQEMGIFDGLCRLLGDDNVITYPYKPTYYGLVDRNYKLPEGRYGFTSPPEQIPPRQEGPWSKQRILDHIDTFDLVYLASLRQVAVEAARELWSNIRHLPLAMTDTEDHEGYNISLVDEFTPVACFKRSLTPYLHERFPFLHPLPFSAIPYSSVNIDDTKKTLDVFAVFGNTHPVREELAFILKALLPNLTNQPCHVGLAGNSFLGRYKGSAWGESHLPYKAYLQHIASSRISFVIRGFGLEALRAWEIPLFETCAFWAYNPNWIYPYPFEDNRHVVYFREDLQDLPEKLDYYLHHTSQAMTIARAGKAHLYQYHTSDKRAAYMLDIITRGSSNAPLSN